MFVGFNCHVNWKKYFLLYKAKLPRTFFLGTIRCEQDWAEGLEDGICQGCSNSKGAISIVFFDFWGLFLKWFLNFSNRSNFLGKWGKIVILQGALRLLGPT